MNVSPFDDERHALNYSDLRSPPPEIIKEYLNAMIPDPSKARRIADVGAGVGTFALALSRALLFAVVDALEPALPMYKQLSRNVEASGLKNLHARLTTLDELPSEPIYDLVLLSEVVQLLPEPLLLADKLVALVRDGGRIAIRTSSQQQLCARDWYRFFPRARLVDMRRHPPLDLLGEAFRYHGFMVSETIIDESRSVPVECFRRLLEERGYSTLHLISERDFNQGLKLLSEELADAKIYRYDYKMTLLVARKRP